MQIQVQNATPYLSEMRLGFSHGGGEAHAGATASSRVFRDRFTNALPTRSLTSAGTGFSVEMSATDLEGSRHAESHIGVDPKCVPWRTSVTLGNVTKALIH